MLDPFQSVDKKERPAIKQHLTNVYQDVLSSPPQAISLAFEDEVVVQTIPKSASEGDGVIRMSTFRVIGEYDSSCYLCYVVIARIFSPFSSQFPSAIFDNEDVEGITTAQAANVLDQATLYAFVEPEKEAFLQILSNTGEPILSETVEEDVSVSKVQFSVGSNEDPAKIINDESFDESEAGETTSSSSWIQPALISGAALLVAATSGAALILMRQRRQQLSEDNVKPNNEDSPRSLEETACASTPTPTNFMNGWKKKKFDYAEFEDDPDVEASTNSPSIMTPSTSKYLDQPTQDIKFSQFMNTSFDDSSVSDVSAHLLGAKGTMKKIDGVVKDYPDSSQAESFLLDTTMDSYNMEAMSALENVRLENVLQIEGVSGIPDKRIMGDDSSLSTGDVPSELYSNLSMDSSAMQSHDGSGYGSHLITLDMIRNKDNSLLVLPPPPSDAASDSSSYQDTKNLYVESENLMGDFEDDPEEDSYAMPSNWTGNQNYSQNVCNGDAVGQVEVSKSINDELSKVMELLKSPVKNGQKGEKNAYSSPKKASERFAEEVFNSPESSAEIYVPSESDNESSSVAGSSILGGLARDVMNTANEDVQAPAEDEQDDSSLVTEALDSVCPVQEKKEVEVDAAVPDPLSQEEQLPMKESGNDGVNVLVVEESDDDENDPLKVMNNAINDCMDILDKARPRS